MKKYVKATSGDIDFDIDVYNYTTKALTDVLTNYVKKNKFTLCDQERMDFFSDMFDNIVTNTAEDLVILMDYLIVEDK